MRTRGASGGRAMEQEGVAGQAGQGSVMDLPAFVERAALAADMDVFPRIPSRLWPQVARVAEQAYFASIVGSGQQQQHQRAAGALELEQERANCGFEGLATTLVIPLPRPTKAKLVLSNYFSIINGNRTTVISQPQAVRALQDNIVKMNSECNDGYGIVPITRNAGMEMESGGASSAVEQDKENRPTYSTAAMRNQRPKPLGQAKVEMMGKAPKLQIPRIPANGNSVIFQAEFKNRRQGLFMSVDRSESGDSIATLVGKYVILTMDEGVDLALLRTYELFPIVVGGIPNAADVQSKIPYVHIIRRASEPEIQSLYFKAQEEFAIFKQCVNFRKKLSLSMMRITGAEFQFDRSKLIIFADMLQWHNFNDLVQAIRTECERSFRYSPRIFIQRRFVLRFRPPRPWPMFFVEIEDDESDNSIVDDEKKFFVPPGKDFQSFTIAYNTNKTRQPPRGLNENLQKEGWKAASSSAAAGRADFRNVREVDDQGDHMSAPDGGPLPVDQTQ